MFDLSSTLFWYKLHFITELLVAEALVTYTLNKRPRFGWRVLLSVIALYALAFAFPIMGYNALTSSLMFFALFIASVAALKVCYEESWLNTFFCGLIAYTAQHISYELNSLLGLVMGLKSINVYLPNGPEAIGAGIPALNIAVYLSVFALVYWFVWAFIAVRIRRQRELVFINFYLFFWALITITIDIVFSAIVTYHTANHSDTMLIMFNISNIFSCCLSLGYQYLMLEKDNVARELITIQMLWKKDKERYELSKENIELLNVRCHDLASQIGALRNINGFVDDNAIIELENALSFYGVNIHTGNDALDVILAEKHILCDKKGIRLSCMIDGEKLSFISPAELYSLFGNALQNAIESAEKIDDPTRRLIIVSVKSQANMVFIHIENSCPDNLLLHLVDGLPETTKSDKLEHGYGMKSIQLLCQRLGGDSDFTMENSRFSLDIVLPMPREKRSKKTNEKV